jgi:hypothetical protein
MSDKEKGVLEGEKDKSEKGVLKEGSEAHQPDEEQAEVKIDSNIRQAGCGKNSWITRPTDCGACEACYDWWELRHC